MPHSRKALKLLEELHSEAARIDQAIAAVQRHIQENSEGDWEAYAASPVVDFLRREQLARGFMASPTMSFLLAWNTGQPALFMAVNEAFQRVTGYRSEEVVGRSFEELNLWVDSSELDAAMKSFSREGRLADFEYCFRRKDGMIRNGLMAADTVEIGSRIAMVASTLDVTDRKRRTKAALEKALATRADSIFWIS